MPWPLLASGRVPSYVGGWYDVLEGQATTLRGVDRKVTLGDVNSVLDRSDCRMFVLVSASEH